MYMVDLMIILDFSLIVKLIKDFFRCYIFINKWFECLLLLRFYLNVNIYGYVV